MKSEHFRQYFPKTTGLLPGAVFLPPQCQLTDSFYGCYPFSRPVPGTFFQFGNTEIADYSLPAMGINLGFIGRVPGGNPIATSDPRPPSPNYYKIGPAASFQFDGSLFTQPAEPFTTWCSTKILGIRPTLNGEPVDFPFYFCRTIASP